MAAPTFVAESESAWNTTTSPKVSGSLSVTTGDVLLDCIGDENFTTAENYTTTNSGTAQTWTEYRPAVTNNSDCSAQIHAAISTVTASLTVTSTRAAGDTGDMWGKNVLQYTGTAGIGATANSNSAQSVSITVSADSSIVAIVADWSAQSWGATTRPWISTGGVGAPIEMSYFNSGPDYTVGIARWEGVPAGTYTVGLTGLGGTGFCIQAIEVKGTASGGSTTGSGSASGAAAAASGSGAVGQTGSGSATAAQATASGLGAIRATGSGAATAPSATATGSGTTSAPSTTGSGAATGPAATAAGSGTATTGGTGAASAPGGSATGSGTASTAGTGSSPAAPAQATGSGQVTATGSGSATAPAAMASGQTGTPSATGSGSASAAPGVAVGSGTARTTGNGSATSAAGAVDGDGSVTTTGSGSAIAPQGIAEGSEPPPPTEFQGRILAARIATPAAFGVVTLPDAAGSLAASAVRARLSILRATGEIT